MTQPVRHNHDCQTCGNPMDCDGELERNFDGWPEVVCVIYHLDGKDVCEECATRSTEDEDDDADLDAEL